jgi:hypothetical protein
MNDCIQIGKIRNNGMEKCRQRMKDRKRYYVQIVDQTMHDEHFAGKFIVSK